MKVAVTKRFVLDASVTAAWCFEDETTNFTESLLDSLSEGAEAIAPSIWPLEVANVLLIAERRKRIAFARAAALLQRIGELPVTVAPIGARLAFEQILPVARQHGLSQYDASYLELALRLGLPLATLDNELRRSAQKIGVDLLSP